MNVTISLDRTVNSEKPASKEAGKITKRFVKTSMTVEQLATALVLPYGNTFCPAVYSVNGARSEATWDAQQVYALDFDNGITFEEVLARAIRFNIEPSFAYTSFSSNETNHKFRVVWVMDSVTKDSRTRNVNQASLMEIFSEADAHCKDAARMYYGGKTIIHSNFSGTINEELLKNALCLFLETTTGDNSARNIGRFAKRHGINTLNGWPELASKECQNGRNGDNPYTNKYNGNANPSILGYSFAPEGESPVNTKATLDLVQNVDFHKLANDCPVFSDFMQGIDVSHGVTWFVMNSLLRLKGGEDMFWRGWNLRTEKNLEKWQMQIRQFRKENGKYLPSYRYGPVQQAYPDLEMPFNNLYEVAQSQFGNLKLVSPVETSPLHVLEERVSTAISNAFADAEIGADTITLLKAPTGIGKTECVLRLLATTTVKCVVVAFSTHKLKADVARRASHLKIQVTPELPTGPWSEAVDRLYSLGAASAANMLLREHAKEQPLIAEYLKQLTEIHPEGIIFTTHARLPYLPFKPDFTIIDEDILRPLMSSKSASLVDLHSLLELMRPRKAFRPSNLPQIASPAYDSLIKLADLVAKARDGDQALYRLPAELTGPDGELAIVRKELETVAIGSDAITSNILGLLSADYFSVNGKVINYNNFISYKPAGTALIMSATLDEGHCRRAFGDNVNFIDVGLAPLAGKVILHNEERMSFSRASMEANREYSIEMIKHHEELNRVVLTFKEWAKYTKNPDLYFGNLAGLDTLKGVSTAVVGNPNLPSFCYVHMAASLGYDVFEQPHLNDMHFESVNHGGFVSRMMTMTTEVLKSMQFYSLNSELVQAIGRSRPLREAGVEVHVYSPFGIAGAILAK
jgi:hypothetical protein